MEQRPSQQAEANPARSEALVTSPVPDLSRTSLRELGDWDDAGFERSAAAVLRQLGRVDSSVAGHNS